MQSFGICRACKQELSVCRPHVQEKSTITSQNLRAELSVSLATIMPVVLGQSFLNLMLALNTYSLICLPDYDREGGVIGGHTVEELPQHHLLTTFEYGSQQPRPLYELQHYQRGLPKARNLGPPDCHRSLSTPPFHHPYRLSVFSKIHQACRRPSPAVSSKGGTFLTIFTKHFEHDASTMIAFEALFTDYNQKAIDETEFYVGIFMLISRMQAWHLLPALVEVLPASWQARDLTWLHEAAEAHYEDMVRARGASSGSSGKTRPKKFDSCLSDEREHSPVHMVEDASDADSGHTSTPQKDTPPPAKHVKRKPFNGLRTSYISAQEGLKSLYINPLALLIHQSVPEAMPNPDEVTQRPVPQPKRSRKGLVTLKLRSAKSAAVRRAKAGITKGQMTQESNEETAGLDITETSKLKSMSTLVPIMNVQNDVSICGELLIIIFSNCGPSAVVSRNTFTQGSSSLWRHACC